MSTWREEDLQAVLQRPGYRVAGAATGRPAVPPSRAQGETSAATRVIERVAGAALVVAHRRPKAVPVDGYATKLEAAYALELEAQRAAGAILDYWYEPFSLRLARKTYYRPDFLVQCVDGQLEIRETKGHWEDDARVKIKVAAEKYPCFRFVAVQRKKGAWVFESF